MATTKALTEETLNADKYGALKMDIKPGLSRTVDGNSTLFGKLLRA
ncbi:hypothetical protein [Candidatus Sororendozoicomonas aggregata]